MAVRLSYIITSTRLAGIVLATSAAIAAGCSGSAYGGSPNVYPTVMPNPSPSPTVAPGVQIIGANLFGPPAEAATNDATYGRVIGYFNSTGAVDTSAQVVRLTAARAVVFESFEPAGGAPHTASFLGNASAAGASFPAHFNGNSTAAPAGAVISAANFSSGSINPGAMSLQYNAGPPGFYMFGCAFHYDAFGMRTVIIVQ